MNPSKEKTRPTRDEVADLDLLCEHCEAKCCRYFALPIDKPDSRQDFDFMRWFLLHEHATVFTEDDTWYLLVHTKCKQLQDDNRCGIYDHRPRICRDYTTRKCEYENDFVYEQYFELPEQVEEYAEAVLGPVSGGSLRSEKPCSKAAENIVG